MTRGINTIGEQHDGIELIVGPVRGDIFHVRLLKLDVRQPHRFRNACTAVRRDGADLVHHIDSGAVVEGGIRTACGGRARGRVPRPDGWIPDDGAAVVCHQAQFVRSLADALRSYDVATVCGPLVGGAFLAQLLAERLSVEFAYAERIASPRDGVFQAEYRVPRSLGAGASSTSSSRTLCLVFGSDES